MNGYVFLDVNVLGEPLVDGVEIVAVGRVYLFLVIGFKAPCEGGADLLVSRPLEEFAVFEEL